MQIDILTLFPEMFDNVFDMSIVGRAQKNGIVQINKYQIRDFSQNKHKNVDDYPYGGGEGMVMEPKCLEAAIDAANADLVCYLSPKGRKLDQNLAKILSKQQHIAFLCGHYEGIDERIIEEKIDLEISLSDFVLTGGEIPAMAVIDSVVRLIDGVLSEPQVEAEESFYNNRLEYPQYTRPEEWNGITVPEVLLSGNHANIAKWRDEKSLEITAKRRPDLLKPQKIGILGGSFNPVHNGHLDIASKAKKLHNIDKILLVPCNIQPFKQDAKTEEAHHRLAMLQIAANETDWLEVSTMELDRGGISYTIDTVRELVKNLPNDELFFIIGEDCEIEKWKDYEELAKLVQFIKLPREIEVSSTEVRTGDVENIPQKVAKYIEKNGLYD